MSKKILLAALIIIIAIVAFVALKSKKETSQPPVQKNNDGTVTLTPLNAQYWVETQIIPLENGKAETVAPYGGAKQTTEISGEPIIGDFNSDGQPDYAVILKQQTADDLGVYYYAAIALVDQPKNLIVGSNAVPLGDRIEIQNFAVVNNAVKVDYLDWKTDGDNVEKTPTAPASKTFILDGVMFKELTDRRANAQVEAACTDNGGTWNKSSLECKGLGQEWCAKTGGKFSDTICKF
ncbi:MAG: hypothetical protein WCX69_03680 [Candidatus Paceibacterota bacterium]